jgi:thioesterase domain-containing protein
MADVYLDHLRAAQREGPYYLGGYSFGGYVALEMARRLLAQGEEIRALILLDTYARETKTVVGRFLTLSTAQKVTYVKRRAARYRKSLKHRIDFLFLPSAVKAVRRSTAAAENNYRLSSYPEKIFLFRASEKGLRGLEDASGGWNKYALGGIEIHEIDGDHGNVLNEPNVQVLAQELRELLERAQAEQPVEVSMSGALPQADLQLN